MYGIKTISRKLIYLDFFTPLVCPFHPTPYQLSFPAFRPHGFLDFPSVIRHRTTDLCWRFLVDPRDTTKFSPIFLKKSNSPWPLLFSMDFLVFFELLLFYYIFLNAEGCSMLFSWLFLLCFYLNTHPLLQDAAGFSICFPCLLVPHLLTFTFPHPQTSS